MDNLPGLMFMALIPTVLGIVLVHTYRKYRSAQLLQASGIETTGLCSPRSSSGTGTMRDRYPEKKPF
ncbi:hypothetical protein [Streptomyces sp. NPDC005890]|uniref:hypothetical protein n=1 Tax=Streptomyces sp. NPDC005890 TaxID=3154568 RepID=UPI0033C099E9